MNFPSVLALDKYGLRVGVLIGIFGTTAGLWLRCLIQQSFWFVIAGQTVVAFAQPFLYNAPALVTSNWFPYQERSVATMVGTSANLFGVGLGFLVPKMFISVYDDSADYTQPEIDHFSD